MDLSVSQARTLYSLNPSISWWMALNLVQELAVRPLSDIMPLAACFQSLAISDDPLEGAFRRC